MAEQLLLDRGPAPLPPYVTAFSLHQPYAGLVAAGMKDETRMFPWPVKARPFPAPLLICSTAKVDREAMMRFSVHLPYETLLACEPRGVALAIVDVVGCRPLVEADLPRSWFWDPVGDKGRTRYLWTIANVRRVAPFAVSGGQTFSKTVPREQIEKALAAWKAAT